MKKTRIAAFFAAVAVALAALSACRQGREESPPQETAPASAAVSAAATSPLPASAAEPKACFQGYTFTVGATDRAAAWWPAESESARGKELFDRLASLEEEYDFQFEFLEAQSTVDHVLPALLGGNAPWDTIRLGPAALYPLARQGYLQNFDTPEMAGAGLDTGNSAAVYAPLSRLSVFDGKQWGVAFASEYERPGFGHCFVFNKDLAARAGFPAEALYQKVRDGGWNFSAYKALAAALAEDADGDGMYEIYSSGGGNNPYGAEVALAGGSAVALLDGRWVCALGEPEAVEGLSFMRDVFAAPHRLKGEAAEARAAFASGACASLWAADFYLDSPELRAGGGAGLLPMPKGDSAEGYADAVASPFVLAMFRENTDYEVNVPIFALWLSVMNSEEGWRKVLLEETLKGSAEDMEMLTEYILPNAVQVPYAFCPALADIVENGAFRRVRDGAIPPEKAAEAYEAQIQSLLDKNCNS